MNLKKLFVTLLIITVILNMMTTVVLAKSKTVTKEKDIVSEGNVLDNNVEASGEVVAVSGEESGESLKEEANPIKAEEEPVSGDPEKDAGMSYREEEPVSGDPEKDAGMSYREEEPVGIVSGEEQEATSGEETIELSSGDEEKKFSANDVSEDKWYYAYVKEAVAAGLMKLDEDGNFNPNKNATRKDAFDALATAFNKTYSVNVNNPEKFLEVDVTREEVAYIVYKYAQTVDMGFKGSWMFLLEFEDRYEISEDAYESVAWCVVNEILIGRPDNTLGPKDVASRAELATIMTRLSNLFNA